MLLWPLLKTSVRVTMQPALTNQRASRSEAPAGRPSVTGTSNDGEWLQLQHPPGAGLHPLLHPPGAGLHPLLLRPPGTGLHPKTWRVDVFDVFFDDF